MPNWKSYDSSVRLLSAILAAHPELKLNYAEIGSFMDDSCTAGGIQFRFRRIKQGAALLKDAVDKGVNPSTIPFGDGDGEIATYMEKKCTGASLEHRFRKIKKGSALMKEAVAQNIDPITIPIGDIDGSVADRMGADVNVMALQNAMKGPRKNAAILDQAFLAGEDLAVVPIHDIGQGTGKEISKFCTGTNKNGIEHAMRGIRKDAENISEAVKAGTNTWEVPICGIGQNIIPKGLAYDVFTSQVSKFYTGTNAKGIMNAMTGIRKDVQNIMAAVEAGTSTEEVPLCGIGQGTTPKAVAKHIEPQLTQASLSKAMAAIRNNSVILRDAIAAGDHPDSVPIAILGRGTGTQEMAKYFEAGTTAKAIRNHLYRNVTKDVARLKQAVSDGTDPMLVQFGMADDIAKYFDPSVSSMSAQKALQNLKRDSKILRDSVDAGGSPQDVPVSFIGQSNGKELAKHMDSNVTTRTLRDHILACKKFGKVLTEAVASGTLAENVHPSGGGGDDTPARKAATPRAKATPKSVKKQSSVKADPDGASEDFDADMTPTKKATGRKVVSGRIAKKSSPVKKPATKISMLSDGELENDENDAVYASAEEGKGFPHSGPSLKATCEDHMDDTFEA